MTVIRKIDLRDLSEGERDEQPQEWTLAPVIGPITGLPWPGIAYIVAGDRQLGSMNEQEAKAVVAAHNAALAAEREKAHVLSCKLEATASQRDHLLNQLAAERENLKAVAQLRDELREQLAAEREKVKTLGEALRKMPEIAYQTIIEHAGVIPENLPNELQCIHDDALAKVKEGK
jgi:hypothetical protein